VHTGTRGRPPHICPPGLLLAQVVKSDAQRHVVDVARRVVLGSTEAVTQVLTTASGGAHQINTASIERLNATFRACLAPLARRTWALAHGDALLTAGMFLVGTSYNFVWPHESLRLPNEAAGPKWRERTPPGGRRAHRPLLDDGGTAALPDGAGALGGRTPAQTARPPAQSPSHGGRRMTMLKCGATMHRGAGLWCAIIMAMRPIEVRSRTHA